MAGDYTYAELDSIRARKARERAKRFRQPQPQPQPQSQPDHQPESQSQPQAAEPSPNGGTFEGGFGTPEGDFGTFGTPEEDMDLPLIGGIKETRIGAVGSASRNRRRDLDDKPGQLSPATSAQMY